MDERPLLRIVTVVDDDVAVGDLRLAAVEAYAKAVWRPHVDLHFDLPRSWAVRCAPTLTLRLTDNGRSQGAVRSDATIGWIDFVDGEPSATINASPATAREWASHQRLGGERLTVLPPRAKSNLVERALGRAVAHEVGHYLFRSQAHTSAGLMKARFSTHDIDEHWPSAMRRAASETWRTEVARRLNAAAPCQSVGATSLD